MGTGDENKFMGTADEIKKRAAFLIMGKAGERKC